MQRILLAFFALCVAAPAVLAETKIGEFETKLETRSPLSNRKTLAERLGAKDAADDDDLSDTTFVCYAPPDAAKAGALGLLVWLNYRPVDGIPAQLKPMLDKTRTIMIVAKPATQPSWARAGLAVDAVTSLKALYTIDDRRIYLLSLLKPDDSLGQQMGLSFGDVFSGFIYVLNFRYFRAIPAPGEPGATYAASFSRPANGMLTAASKSRRHILVGDNNFSDTNNLITHAYQQDGYKAALTETSMKAVRWPDIDPTWVAAAMELLDAAGPTTVPAAVTGAPREPVPQLESDGRRLLSLAKAYDAARQPELAKSKLRELLMRFPNDPNAKEAQRMLDELEKP